jgi:hypothetical protein
MLQDAITLTFAPPGSVPRWIWSKLAVPVACLVHRRPGRACPTFVRAVFYARGKLLFQRRPARMLPAAA